MDVVIKPFNARPSKRLVPIVRQLYTDGDTVIALFDAQGAVRDGKPYRNTYTCYMKMEGGAIVEAIASFDTIEFTPVVWPEPRQRYFSTIVVMGYGRLLLGSEE